MADPKRSLTGKPSGRDLKGPKKSIVGMPLEHIAGSKVDKNRRRIKSVASQFAHPMTGETVKERQVQKLSLLDT